MRMQQYGDARAFGTSWKRPGARALAVLVAIAAITVASGCGNGDAPEAEGGGGTPGAGGSGERTERPALLDFRDDAPAGDGPATANTGALTWSVPDAWDEIPPATRMRHAQFVAPGDDGPAEVVVFYFGPGQGGGADANAERWAGQFSHPDGTPALDTLTKRLGETAHVRYLWVEAHGTYRNPMTSDPPIADARLLAAIVEGPDANWFFKMTGPQATVEAHREAFQGWIESLRVAPAG